MSTATTAKNIKIIESFEQEYANSSARTAEAYKNDVIIFTNFIGPDTEYGTVNADVLNDYVVHLQKGNYSPRTVNRRLSSVRAFFKFLTRESFISGYPNFTKATLIKLEPIDYKPNVISLKSINRMIDKILQVNKSHALRNAAIIEVLYSCGLRVSELINLKLSNINLEKKCMRVSDRSIPMNDLVINRIKKMLKERESQTVKQAEFVFLNRRGNKLTRVMIFSICKQYAKLCKIKENVSPSTFRNSFAAHMIANGAPHKEISALMGYSADCSLSFLYRQWGESDIVKQHRNAIQR